MATDDHAILVGISSYAQPTTFPDLQGPANDVALFHDWLLRPEGGDVPPHNITTILSPSEPPPGVGPFELPPVTQDFNLAYKRVICDEDARPIRRASRLYLYFSGHGFCQRREVSPQAALYAANATRDFPENIFGTRYAQMAAAGSYFEEVVLIMDCCRDAELNRAPDVPPIAEPSSGAPETGRLLCIYAAPKGGKAQERPIEERGGKVYGLLTHALLKALEEVIADEGDQVTSAALKRHLSGTWNAVCGAQPADPPEMIGPFGPQEIYFNTGSDGVAQKFVFSAPPAGDVRIDIQAQPGLTLARCEFDVRAGAASVAWQGGAAVPLGFDGTEFVLPLRPGFYRYSLSGAMSANGMFAVEIGGAQHVAL